VINLAWSATPSRGLHLTSARVEPVDADQLRAPSNAVSSVVTFFIAVVKENRLWWTRSAKATKTRAPLRVDEAELEATTIPP